MNKRVDLLVFLLIMLSVDCAVIGQNSLGLTVTGRVVSASGAPVGNAVVSLLYPPCPGCIDHIIPSVRTDDHGFFMLEGDNISASEASVFVEQEAPKGYWNPIYPTEVRLSGFAEYHGMKLRGGGRKMEIGDVRPTVEYRSVEIDLRKIFGFDFEVGRRISHALRLSISRRGRTAMRDIAIPEHSINSGIVRMALPTGPWKLEFSLDVQRRKLKRNILVCGRTQDGAFVRQTILG